MRILLYKGGSTFAKTLAAAFRSLGHTCRYIDDHNTLITECDRTADIVIYSPDGGEPRTYLSVLRAAGYNCPFIAVIPSAEPSDRAMMLRSGADDCISAPVFIPELLARIDNVTARRCAAAPPPAEARLGELILDKAAMRLKCGGSSAGLTVKELRILELFFSDPGRHFSSSELLHLVWGDDTQSEEVVVWTYITYLRRKLKAVGCKYGIVNYRGTGYRIE